MREASFRYIYVLRLISFLFIFFFGPTSLWAQESQPGDPCTVGNNGKYRFSGGPELANTGYLLICDGSNWNKVISFSNSGIMSPTFSGSCSNGDIVTFDAATGGLSCSTTCSDNTPSAFNFTDNPSASASTLTLSNVVQVTGFNCQLNVTVNGEGFPQLRTCSDASCTSVIQDWTSSPSPILNNQYIQTRLTSSSAGGDTYTANIFVGNTVENWNVTTTGDCTPADPAIGTICADGTVYAGKSPDGLVKMYVTRCDEGRVWTGATCSGLRIDLPWNDQTGNFTTVGTNSSINGASNTSTLVAADADSVVGGVQPHRAAHRCDLLNSNGHTDWYLPAWNELLVLYSNQNSIGMFDSNGSYWSSTENGGGNARNVFFIDGSTENVGHIDKRTGMWIRCVRK